MFVLDSLTGPLGTKYLEHGGHIWDHDYALTSLMITEFPEGEEPGFEGVIDINAIEAIAAELEDPTGPKLPGDFNGDGKVNAADYVVYRNNLGTGHPLAGNGNEMGSSMGVVDDDDYALWTSNFGAMAGSGSGLSATAAVPEPPASTLLVLATTGLAWWRRRSG